MLERFMRWAANSWITALLPQSLRDRLRPLWLFTARFTFRGDKVYCPVCKKTARDFVRWNQSRICPMCGSLERQRAIYLWLTQKSKIFQTKPCRILHVAPDYCLVKRIRSQADSYVSVDLYDKRATLQADLTKLPLADKSFDIILCSHVLEHIPDDKAAMKELARVLSTFGEMLILVPIKDGKTYEDLSITDPKLREQHFGQWDHVRIYGLDILQRLEAAGLKASTTQATALTSSPQESSKMGLLESDLLFECRLVG